MQLINELSYTKLLKDTIFNFADSFSVFAMIKILKAIIVSFNTLLVTNSNIALAVSLNSILFNFTFLYLFLISYDRFVYIFKEKKSLINKFY